MGTFETHLKALEKIVDRLENGELSLEESVQLFEEGLKHSSSCKKELEAAEGKIQLLMARGREMVATDWDPEDNRKPK
ncbi:MAG TPA: exodeoxyribonuclease VII small subunit [Edaphobacter sp.]|jgi:exodeoxyribonuclease VII small subunit|nr:exodeoxyribonuclease VII small subunit [Edaphobacter sp.]